MGRLQMEAKVYWVANDSLGRLGIMPRPRGGDWLEDEIRSLQFAGVDVLISLLTEPEIEELDLIEEPELCSRDGIEFLSFAMPDRGVPAVDPDAARFFGELMARLRERKTVVVHCRMGIGRSALVAACLLVGTGATAAQAFQLIAQARGCPVPDTPEQRAWVDSYAKHLTQNE